MSNPSRTSRMRVTILAAGLATFGACAPDRRPGSPPPEQRSSASLSAGQMSSARAHPSVTVLTDGRVLLVGGRGEAGLPLASAELYDPLTSRFRPASPSPNPRVLHTATLLADGRVLVAGGQNFGALAAVDLYDPTTDSWSPADPLRIARDSHQAQLIEDGGVVVLGGQDGQGPVSFPETYDPSADRWLLSSQEALGVSGACAGLANQGLVWCGGLSGSLGALQTCWSGGTGGLPLGVFGSLSVGRSHHSLTALPDGGLLAAGGLDSANLPVASIESWAGGWQDGGNLDSPRSEHAALFVPTGGVWVFGGMGAGGTALADTEQVVPGARPTNESLEIPRASPVAAMLHTGSILVAGGQDSTGAALASFELIPVASLFFVQTGPFPVQARAGHSLVLLSARDALLIGGGPPTSASVERYDSQLKVWTPAPSLQRRRMEHRSTVLADGRVLVIGGRDGAAVQASCELYTPSAPAWVAAPDLGRPRARHTATVLGNGRVLVTGGLGEAGTESSSELFLPTLGSWFPVGPMLGAREGHTATLLSDGRVLVTGGRRDGVPLATAELYSPDTDSWSATLPLPEPRFGHAASLLPSGEVLVTGGEDGADILASSLLFSPAQNRWRSTAPLAVGRSGLTLVSFTRGIQVAFGGRTDAGFSGEFDEFDPGVETWRQSPIATAGMEGSAGIALSNERAMFVGGSNGSGPTRLVEIYERPLEAVVARPSLSPVLQRVPPGEALTVSGQALTLPVEGGGGNGLSAGSPFPLFRLRHLESGRVLVARTLAWTRTSARLLIPSSAFAGRYLLGPVVHGVAGDEVDLIIGQGFGGACSATTQCLDGDCVGGVCCSDCFPLDAGSPIDAGQPQDAGAPSDPDAGGAQDGGRVADAGVGDDGGGPAPGQTAPPLRRELTVGCDCSGTGGLVPFAWAMAAGLLFHRRSNLKAFQRGAALPRSNS